VVLDTSALLAILEGEPERVEFSTKIAAADRTWISSATYLEAHIVIRIRRGAAGTGELSLYLHEAGTEIVAVDRDQADLARLAYAQFGRGQHRAALSYGDCFTYALAKTLDQPVLFKGDDFGHTDLVPA